MMVSSQRTSLLFSLSQISPCHKNYEKYSLQDVIQSVKCAVPHDKHNDIIKGKASCSKVHRGKGQARQPVCLDNCRTTWVRQGDESPEEMVSCPREQGMLGDQSPPGPRRQPRLRLSEFLPTHFLVSSQTSPRQQIFTSFYDFFLLRERKKPARTDFVHARHCAGHMHCVPKLRDHPGRWVLLLVAGAWAAELDRNMFESPLRLSIATQTWCSINKYLSNEKIK